MKKKKQVWPISVFIICKNEEDRIHHAINGVKDWVDEIIVVDSGSTDKTTQFAKKLGATLVVYNEWKGYGPQKCYAQKLCKNDWILNLDADEECTAEMQQEIIDLFTANKLEHSAYVSKVMPLPRLSGKRFKHGPCLHAIRFYNQNLAGFDNSIIHDSVRIKSGTQGKLNAVLYHRPFRSFAHAIEKINYYTTLQAEDLFARKRNPSVLRILIEPFWTFLKSYLINLHFLWGVEGVLEAFIYSFARTLRLIKAKELFLQDKVKNKKTVIPGK